MYCINFCDDGIFCQRSADGAQRVAHADLHHQHLQLPGEAAIELHTKVREDFSITEKAPTMLMMSLMTIVSASQFHIYSMWVMP